MKKYQAVLALVSASTLSGCASMTPGLGFDDIRTQVHQRTGADTRWDRGTKEDAQAAQAVNDLLAKELTADAAVQIALLNNRDLQATYEDLDIAQADLVRAGLLKNPVFSGELRFDTSGGGTGIGLDVAQDFLSLLTLSLRKDRAGAALEEVKAKVTSAAVKLAFETRTSFIDFQAAQEVHAMRTTVAQATSASLSLAQRLREAGNIRDLDLLSEQSLFEESKLEVEEAAARVVSTRERLNSLMGVWGAQTAWTAASRLPQLPTEEDSVDELERRAVAASLDLQQSRASVNQAAINAKLARPLAWLDGSEVGVVGDREIEGGWSVGPSVSIPIPIFDGGSATSGEAAARVRQAAAQYYATAVRVRASARSAASALHSTRARVLQHQHTILPLHQKIVDQAQLQYNAMQISGFQLLQAKREQINAGIASIAALRDYWEARADVALARGGSMNESLNVRQGSSESTRKENRQQGAH